MKKLILSLIFVLSLFVSVASAADSDYYSLGSDPGAYLGNTLLADGYVLNVIDISSDFQPGSVLDPRSFVRYLTQKAVPLVDWQYDNVYSINFHTLANVSFDPVTSTYTADITFFNMTGVIADPLNGYSYIALNLNSFYQQLINECGDHPSFPSAIELSSLQAAYETNSRLFFWMKK
jgi:hypothetical protein